MTKIARTIPSALGCLILLAWISITSAFVFPRIEAPDPLTPLRSALLATNASEESVGMALHEYRHTFELDKNIALQYLSFLGQIAHGDLGISVRNYPQSNWQVLAQPLLRMALDIALTVLLFFLSLLLAIFLSLRLPFLAKNLGWIAIPAIALLIWYSPSPLISFPCLILLIMVPLLVQPVTRLGKLQHIQFASGLGIPDSKVGGILKTSMLKAISPSLHSWFGWILGASLIIDSMWGQEGMLSLILSAKENADFSLVRSAATLLVFVPAMVSLLLYLAFPRPHGTSERLFSTSFCWIDVLLFVTSVLFLSRLDEAYLVLGIAAISIAIQYVVPVRPGYFKMIAVLPILPLLALIGIHTPIVLGLFTVATALIWFEKPLNWVIALRGFLFFSTILSMIAIASL